MINCSIHNYKEWMENYLNGNLSREDMLTVDAFLQQHPAILDNYLMELEELSLVPENNSLPSKNEFTITIQSTEHITYNNYQEYFIGFHEGILNDAEKTELDAFIASNPKLKKEFQVYASTRLVADQSVQYPNKNELVKKSRPAVPLFWSVSAAASVILIAGLFMFMPSGKNKQGFTMGSFNHVQINKNIHNDSVISGPKQNITEDAEIKTNNDAIVNNNTQTNYITGRDRSVPVETALNKSVQLNAISNTGDDQLALQNIPEIDEEQPIASSNPEKPKKKGLFDKIFSGEQIYIEDYVNATFGAFKNNKEDDDKWVLKVERDNSGKSKKIKFTSPIISFRTKN